MSLIVYIFIKLTLSIFEVGTFSSHKNKKSYRTNNRNNVQLNCHFIHQARGLNELKIH